MKIATEYWDGENLLVNSDYAELLRRNKILTAVDLWDFASEPIKNVRKDRGTEKILLDDGQTGQIETYIKRYQAFSLKDRITTKLKTGGEIFDAWHEWRALLAFHELNLPTMIPIACARINGKTCNLTLGITDYTRASDLFPSFQAQDEDRKRKLIDKIAELAARMHAANFAHQDFYLVHIFVKEAEDDQIFLIDLQRMVMSGKLSTRWRVKDLGQLLFSARQHVTEQDIDHFWKVYCEIVDERDYGNRRFIDSINAKAAKIERHDRKRAAKKK